MVNLFRLGLSIVLIGFLLALVSAIALIALSAISQRPGFAGGVCVIIGIVPICLGYGDPALIIPLVILALAMVIASYVLMREYRRRFNPEVSKEIIS